MRWVFALIVLACTACAVAQDASECEAPLAELSSQLADAQARLAAAEASSSSCMAEASSLKEKLQQTEASLSGSDKTALELAEKLEETEAKLKTAPDAAAIEQLKAAVQAAEEALIEVTRKLAAKEGEASGAETKLLKCDSDLQAQSTDYKALQLSMEEAASTVGSCTEQQQVLEAAVMVAEAKAKALEGAWLPPWVAASVALALAQAQKLAKQYTVQGRESAKQMWRAHGLPALNRGLEIASDKASQLNAAIEAKAGKSWPKFKAGVSAATEAAATHGAAAAAAAKKHAVSAWNSEAVANVHPALMVVGSRVVEQAQAVQKELEELLIRVLAKNNNTVPLARRPYVTYIVYAALVVPLVAFGMPLLGLRRSRSKPATSTGGTPMSTKKKKKPAPRAH